MELSSPLNRFSADLNFCAICMCPLYDTRFCSGTHDVCAGADLIWILCPVLRLRIVPNGERRREDEALTLANLVAVARTYGDALASFGTAAR